MLFVYAIGWCGLVDCLSHEEKYQAGLIWLTISLVATVLNYWLTFYHETGCMYRDYWGKWGKAFFIFATLPTFPVMPYTVFEFWASVKTHNRMSG
ncbi:MAG: hypothetical protein HYZ63_01960 [Candidatus Andersenbacteria bacterium]|nr:hypothetical protein [Candidatus Andersenbacteria bacterium]